MSDITDLNVPLPGRGAPDFQQPIQVSPDGVHGASLYFDWGQRTVGFGQCSIHRDSKTGEITADTEGMGKEWLRRALYAAVDVLVENAKLT
jgi:hypothetical protein